MDHFIWTRKSWPTEPWNTHGTLSGATTPGQSWSWNDVNEAVLRIPKASVLLEPHHQIVYCIIQDTRWGSITPRQRWSWSIPQPLPTGPPGHSLERSYPFAEKQSVYSTAPADRAMKHRWKTCRVDLGVIAIKEYYTLTRFPGPLHCHRSKILHHRTPLRTIPRISLFGLCFLPFCSGYSQHIWSPTERVEDLNQRPLLCRKSYRIMGCLYVET